MFLVPWKPFEEIEKLFREEDLFPVIPTRWQKVPRMDVYETDKDIVAEVEAPGVKPENIDISLRDGVLTIKGQGEEKKEEKDKNYYRKEIRKGYFERSVVLPTEVKEEEVKATYKDGVLKIVMPKKEEKETKGTKIKVEKE